MPDFWGSFDQGAQAQDKMALQSMMENAAAQRAGQQQAYDLEKNFTHITPQQMSGMHPEVSKYVQGMGEAMPNGNVRIAHSIMPSIQTHAQYIQTKDAKTGMENALKEQLNMMHRDPNTGLSTMPDSVKMLHSRLGSGTVDDKAMDALQTHMQSMEMFKKMQDMEGSGKAGGTESGTRLKRTVEMTPTGPRMTISEDLPTHPLDARAAAASNGRTGWFRELSPPERLIAQKLQDKHDVDLSGDKARNITINQGLGQAQVQEMVLGKDNKNWYNPDNGMLAANVPGSAMWSPKQAREYGFYNTGGTKETGDLINRALAVAKADSHYKNATPQILKIIDSRPDLFPQIDPRKMTGMMKARAAEAWKHAISVGDPAIAQLATLELASLQMMQSMQGSGAGAMRGSLGLLNYTSERLPTSAKQPWSNASAKAAWAAMGTNLAAARQAALSIPSLSPGGTKGSPQGYNTPAGQGSVSGTSWGKVKEVPQ